MGMATNRPITVKLLRQIPVPGVGQANVMKTLG